jgi:hypothetical protein
MQLILCLYIDPGSFIFLFRHCFWLKLPTSMYLHIYHTVVQKGSYVMLRIVNAVYKTYLKLRNNVEVQVPEIQDVEKTL